MKGDAIRAAQAGDVVELERCFALGAPVDEQDWLGRTPLMWAVVKWHPAAVRFIIEHKANVNHVTKLGQFALQLAVNYNYRADTVCLELLRAGADKRMTFEGKTAAEIASLRRLHQIVNAIESYGAVRLFAFLLLDFVSQKCQRGRIFNAVRHGFLRLIQECLDNDADVNERNEDGDTPLIVASREYGLIYAVRLLIERKADLHARNHLGEFALFEGAESRSRYICEALLKAGADKTMTCYGETPAQHARSSYSNWDLEKFIDTFPVRSRLVCLLIDLGPNIDAGDCLCTETRCLGGRDRCSGSDQDFCQAHQVIQRFGPPLMLLQKRL